MKLPFSIRPLQDSDTEFLSKLYASTRLDIQQLIDWTPDQKEQFLRMQFDAQQTHYKSHFPGAECNIVVNGKRKPIGRLYVEQREEEVRVIDISLMPDCRRKGIGSKIIKDVMERARLVRLPVRLHVARFNPALSWYFKMGFEQIGETDMTFLMEWSFKNRKLVIAIDDQDTQGTVLS